MVPGPHTSCVISTSVLTQTLSLGATLGRSHAFAMIFSVRVIGSETCVVIFRTRTADPVRIASMQSYWKRPSEVSYKSTWRNYRTNLFILSPPPHCDELCQTTKFHTEKGQYPLGGPKNHYNLWRQDATRLTQFQQRFTQQLKGPRESVMLP